MLRCGALLLERQHHALQVGVVGAHHEGSHEGPEADVGAAVGGVREEEAAEGRGDRGPHAEAGLEAVLEAVPEHPQEDIVGGMAARSSGRGESA